MKPTNKKSTGNQKQSSKSGNYRGKQGRKDSRQPRVNLDNMREDKLDEAVAKGLANDFTWYNRYPSLIEGAARIPFGSIVGTREEALFSAAVPGICVITYEPTIGGRLGVGGWKSVGINQSAESRYSFVTHANSRNTKYDATDLQMVTVAGASIFSLLGMGERVYGLMRQYSPVNAYKPKAVIESLGFDFEDLQNNYSHMWFDINQRIARANQIWIPKDQPIINRWFWMNTGLFKDSTGDRAQLYAFTPRSYLQYSETVYNTGTALIRKLITSDLTWDGYLAMVDEALTALLESMDRGTMYGDILKAYGAENIFALNEIPLDYVTPVLYSPEVLTQIENLTVLPTKTITQGSVTSYSPGLGDIAQYDNTIIQNWKGMGEANQAFSKSTLTPWFSPGSSLLNFHNLEQPNVEAVTVATRLKCGTSRYTTVANVDATTGALIADAAIVPYTTATELVVRVLYYGYDRNGDLAQSNASYWDASSPFISTIAAAMAFDWAPWIYNPSYQSTSGNVSKDDSVLYNSFYNLILGDWDNYTFIDDTTLDRIHLAAELSLWGMKTI